MKYYKGRTESMSNYRARVKLCIVIQVIIFPFNALMEEIIKKLCVENVIKKGVYATKLDTFIKIYANGVFKVGGNKKRRLSLI